MGKLHFWVAIGLLCLHFPANNNIRIEPVQELEHIEILVSFDQQYGGFFDCNVKLCLQDMKSLLPQVESIASRYALNSELVLAVVAPEMLRYSVVKDFFETEALEVLYVNGGSEFADFSIGSFQMKPSFAAQLEDQIASLSTHFQFKALFHYPDQSARKIRAARIERLKSMKWQIHYACLFCLSMAERHSISLNNASSDEVAFLAAAYNLGVGESYSRIKKWQQANVFPYGESYGNNQCSYSDLACAIYRYLK
jgi:hypothetical protein